MNLEENYYCLKEKVFGDMLERNEDKFRQLIFLLKLAKYIPSCRTRGQFLEAYYVYMRAIDDVCDRDSPVPSGFDSAVEFVLDKLDFSRRLIKPRDNIDHTLLYCNRLASRFGEDFSSETDDILGSMLFDARRYGKNIVYPDSELKHHFYLLDIRGTIRATLKIYGEDPDKFHFLEPLGNATRVYYDLRDYCDDSKAGLVNISQEDVTRLGITDFDTNSEGVKTWFKEQASRGLDLLGDHRRNLGPANLGLLARLTLPRVYENDARNYFKGVLGD